MALFPPDLLRAVPWGHHAELLAKVREPETRQWYMQATVQHGWSRNILLMQIETSAHRRAGKTTSNFATRLPPPESDLVQQALKDPDIFDFLTLADGFRERELETGLVAHLEKFLLELGQGFAFVGRQYHLDVGDQDFYIDLLFYHLKLRRYVVIDLKRGDFKPEKLAIADTLDTGLPEAYTKELFTQKCDALFEHVYESYPERDRSRYAA